MKRDRIRFMCPYLDGSPNGAVCNAINDLLKNIQDIDLKICMGRHFESCHVYVSVLKTLTQEHLASISVEMGK